MLCLLACTLYLDASTKRTGLAHLHGIKYRRNDVRTYFRTNRRLYGLTVGGPNSRANRPKDERADERLDGRLDERLDSQLGGRTVGRTDGWTASWADGQLGGRTVVVVLHMALEAAPCRRPFWVCIQFGRICSQKLLFFRSKKDWDSLNSFQIICLSFRPPLDVPSSLAIRR